MPTTVTTTTTTAARTEVASGHESETWEIIIQVAVLAVILIGAVIGNALVCLCVYLRQEMRSITAMFLVNLAIADLGTGVFCLPMAIATILDVSILGNKTICNLNAFCIVLFFITSINTMAATSVYKYWTVGFPMKSRMTRKNALYVIVLIWLVSIILAAGPIFGWNQYYLLQDRFQCSPKSPETLNEYSHLFALLLFGYALPVPLMTFCYARVYCISKSHFNRMRRNTVSDINLLKSETHLIATLWIVLVAFILCWLPFVIYLIAGIIHSSIPYYLPILAFTFGYSNSTLNPVVYGLRLKSFREGFKDIILGCCKKKHSAPAYLTYKGGSNVISDNTANTLRTTLPQNALKKASVAYVLPGSNNKAFVIEEGAKSSRKVSAYKISATKTYPILLHNDASSRPNSPTNHEDGSFIPQEQRSSNSLHETVAVLEQARKKSTNRRKSTFENAFPRLYPSLSRQDSGEDNKLPADSRTDRDSVFHNKINRVIEDEEGFDVESDQCNNGIELDERIVTATFDKQIDVISLTETRFENFTKVINLCQFSGERSPQGEYQISRNIDSKYDIHVIVNPSAMEINEFGSTCICKVLRTLTWEDTYFDSLGNSVMTIKHEVAKNEELDVHELPLYMREHVRLERQMFFVSAAI